MVAKDTSLEFGQGSWFLLTSYNSNNYNPLVIIWLFVCLFCSPTPSQNRKFSEGKASVPDPTGPGSSPSSLNAHPVTWVLREENPPTAPRAAFPLGAQSSGQPTGGPKKIRSE